MLIVGAGPAGLEAAQALGKRGYAVTLAEKGREPGGRVRRESRLPGLAAWSRVVEYRVGQLHKLPNVEVYFDSELDAAAVLEFGAPRVVLATGARWRSDGIGHCWTRPMPVAEGADVLTPDDLMGGRIPGGQRVLVWDDDHYYMGGVLAELLAEKGFETVYATPASEASTWTRNTMEQFFIQARLLEKGVRIETFRNLDRIAPGAATLACVHTGRAEILAADAVVLVTSRSPVDELAVELAVTGGRLERCRHRVRRSHRRRVRPGDDRPRGLRGPALCGRARRTGRYRRLPAISARTDRARRPLKRSGPRSLTLAR